MTEAAAREHAAQELQVEHGPKRLWLALPLTAGVAAVLATGLLDLPRESAALPQIALHAVRIALPVWGQQEVVNEIVYGSRGWDTFGETFLLLAAVMAVTVLARSPEPRAEYVGEASAGRQEQAEDDPAGGSDTEESEARQAEREEADDGEGSQPPPVDADSDPLGTPAPERAEAMTAVVRIGARIVVVPLAVAAVYLAAWGYSPGGGFPAGAAVAGLALLIYAAFGHGAVSRVLRPGLTEPLELAGAAGIVAIGLLGLLFQHSMFANFLTLAQPGTIRAGGTNQLFSGAELLEVATGLSIAIFSLLGIQHDWARDQGDDQSDDQGDDQSDDQGDDQSDGQSAAGHGGGVRGGRGRSGGGGS